MYSNQHSTSPKNKEIVSPQNNSKFNPNKKKIAIEKITFSHEKEREKEPSRDKDKGKVKDTPVNNATFNFKTNLLNILNIENNFKLDDNSNTVNNKYSQINLKKPNNSTTRDPPKKKENNFEDFITQKVEQLEKCREVKNLSSRSILTASSINCKKLFNERPKFLGSLQFNEFSRTKSPKYVSALLKTSDYFSNSTIGVLNNIDTKITTELFDNERDLERNREQFLEKPPKEKLIGKFNEVFNIISMSSPKSTKVKNKRHTLDHLLNNFDEMLSKVYSKKLINSIHPEDYVAYNRHTSFLTNTPLLTKNKQQQVSFVNEDFINVPNMIQKRTTVEDQVDNENYCDAKLNKLLSKYKERKYKNNDDSNTKADKSSKNLIFQYDKRYLQGVKIHGNYDEPLSTQNALSSKTDITNPIKSSRIFKREDSQTKDPFVTQIFKTNIKNISKEFTTNKNSFKVSQNTTKVNTNDLSKSCYVEKKSNIDNLLNYSHVLNQRNKKLIEGSANLKNSFDNIQNFVVSTSKEKIKKLLVSQEVLDYQ